MADNINPDHYKRLPAEAIEIIESAIDKAPSNQDAYLHGQVLKYVLRCWNKNGIEDLRKAKWYLDRLVDSLNEYEQQKASDIQSLKDHPFGKLKEPAWNPKIGDWVKIKKPESWMYTAWMQDMDKYDCEVVLVTEIEGAAIIHDDWAFEFDWLTPATSKEIAIAISNKEGFSQPGKPLNSDTIPEGYRKLNDSSEEPRQLGDLRWSVAEKRYVEITVDEIGYANRDNWAACRKVESAIKQSLTPEAPDGWRWLEVGEKFFLGDTTVDGDGNPYLKSKISKQYCERHTCQMSKTFIRRNRFEVGEKVVHVDDKEPTPYDIDEYIYSKDAYILKYKDGHYMYHSSKLAPYIEDAK